MPDDLVAWCIQALMNGQEVPLDRLGCRLALALLLGCAVAGIYRLTQRPGAMPTPGFTTTLVMLAVLMAVTTLVIGDNTARAFSLVGALAIVRFRTVVEDTRDTAFVIFAVITGMAAGSGHPLVALVGLGVAGCAAAVVRPRTVSSGERWELSVRVAASKAPEEPLQEVFRKHLAQTRLVATATGRQGSALELTYHVQLRPSSSAAVFVTELNLQAGLQNVEMKRL